MWPDLGIVKRPKIAIEKAVDIYVSAIVYRCLYFLHELMMNYPNPFKEFKSTSDLILFYTLPPAIAL